MSEAPKKPSSIPKPPQRPWRRASFEFKKTKASVQNDNDGRHRDVAKGLEAIYFQKGSQDDLKTLSHTRRSRMLRAMAWVVAGLGVVSLLAWIGLFIFLPKGPASGESLVLRIDGPGMVSLGREETFVLHWSNASFQPLRDVEVRLSAPAEYLIASLNPAPAERNNLSWKLGLVAPGAKGEITIKGVFLGSIGGQSALQAVGTSISADDGKPRQALMTLPLMFGETVLSGRFRMQSKAVAGDQVPVEFILSNRGKQGLRGLKARFQLPSGFSLQSATGTTLRHLGDDEWEQALSELPGSTTGTVRFSGSFLAGNVGDERFSARVGVSRQDGSFLPLLDASTTIAVLAGDLGLHLVANGGDGDRLVSPGDPLRITIEYQNLSPEPISGVRLELAFESLINGQSSTGTSLLDWKNLDDAEDGVSTTRARIQTIVYDKKSVAEFERLDPQERGSIDIAIPTLGVSSGTKDALIRLSLQGTMATVGKDKATRVIRTSPMSFRYRSDAGLKAEARYFTEEGAPIGFGPLPPVAGKSTGYRINWTVNKTLHPLQNLEVSTVLPASVSFGANSSTEAGVMSYDPASRTVRWTLNRMPEGVNELAASFDVQLTPTNFDVGRFAQLISESRFTATDELLAENIVRSLPPLTTDLSEDEGARNKGVVKKGN